MRNEEKTRKRTKGTKRKDVPDGGAMARYMGEGAPNGSAVGRKWGTCPMGTRREAEPRDAKGTIKSKNPDLLHEDA